LQGTQGECICFACHSETSQQLAAVTEAKNAVVRQCHELQAEVQTLRAQVNLHKERESLANADRERLQDAVIIARAELHVLHEEVQRLRGASVLADRTNGGGGGT